MILLPGSSPNIGVGSRSRNRSVFLHLQIPAASGWRGRLQTAAAIIAAIDGQTFFQCHVSLVAMNLIDCVCIAAALQSRLPRIVPRAYFASS